MSVKVSKSAQIIHINAITFMPWPSQRKLATRLKDESLIIRSRAGFTFECRQMRDGSIELSNCTSRANTWTFAAALSIIELIDRMNAPIRQKVAV